MKPTLTLYLSNISVLALFNALILITGVEKVFTSITITLIYSLFTYLIVITIFNYVNKEKKTLQKDNINKKNLPLSHLLENLIN